MRKPKPEYPTSKTPVWAQAATGLDVQIKITLATATLWKQQGGK